jgi:hypothetical protein
LCGAPERPAQLMRRLDFEKHLGRENICSNIGEALDRAKVLRDLYILNLVGQTAISQIQQR